MIERSFASSTLCAAVIAVAAILIAGGRALAACPVSVAAIQPIAHGPDGKTTLYLLKLQAGSAKPVSLSVSLAASNVKSKPVMAIPRFIPQATWNGFGINVTFDWRDANLDAVNVEAVIDEQANVTTCDIDWKTVNTENGGIDTRNLVTSLLTPSPQATPAARIGSFTDAEFVSKVVPEYSTTGGRLAGQTTVLVSIGTDGRPAKAWIGQSSGREPFDAAALHAAKTSTFTPAKFNGQPIVSTYKIVYVFSPAP